MACEFFAAHQIVFLQTYKPTSDGSVAALTAGGRLHIATKSGKTNQVDEPPRRDRDCSHRVRVAKLKWF
jgi:hypothetical protein